MRLRSPIDFKRSDNDEKELLEAQRQAEASFTIAGDRARKCLSTEDFRNYRLDYMKAEVKLLDALLKYNNFFHKNSTGDTSLYAMVVARYLTKLEALRSLLEVITKDAQKGMPSEKS